MRHNINPILHGRKRGMDLVFRPFVFGTRGGPMFPMPSGARWIHEELSGYTWQGNVISLAPPVPMRLSADVPSIEEQTRVITFGRIQVNHGREYCGECLYAADLGTERYLRQKHLEDRQALNAVRRREAGLRAQLGSDWRISPDWGDTYNELSAVHREVKRLEKYVK